MLTGGTLVLALMMQTVAVTPVYADEAVEGEAAAGEEAAGEEGALPEGGEESPLPEGAEGEVPAADAAAVEAVAADTVVPGTIVANNGMYIANSFPDSYLPSGFRKQTVAYEGQNIDLAYMDASNGLVTLAYLTDAAGTFGDFYICDTSTAEMSDYVRFEGGNDRFIIVLKPMGADIPTGFSPTALSVNGKSVSAWVYTGETTDDKDKDKDDKDSEESSEEGSEEKKDGFLGGLLGSLKPVKAYAGELDLGIGVGSGNSEDTANAGGQPADAAPADGTTPEGVPADGAATEGLPADGTATDGVPVDGAVTEGVPADAAAVDQTVDTSGLDAAAAVPTGGTPSTSEYFLVYAIDQTGNLGFYLYDSVGQTYQRYADFGAGSLEKLEKAEKSAKIRLFIIVGLVVLLIVLVIILVNMALSGKKGDDYYDDDDNYEEMKRRVEKKSKRAARVSRRTDYYDDSEYDDDDDDYEDDDDGEDVKVYKKAERKQPAAPQEQLRPRKKAPSQDIDLDDDFSFDFIKR